MANNSSTHENNIYIGNRYVPIFANPVEWNNLRTYEPLTIVTYEGTSYTSRQYVPVGTALTDTDYWVVTGDYNYQVAQYKAEVDALEDTVGAMDTRLTGQINSVNTTLGGRIDQTNSNVTSVSNRVSALELKDNLGTVVCIGDSYLEGVTPSGNVTSWGSRLAPLLGKTYGTTIKAYYKGGAGFGHSVDGINFNTLVNNAYNDIGADNVNNVGAVIIIGGHNEPFELTSNTVRETLMNATNKFPKAKVFYGYGSCGKTKSPYNRIAVTSAYANVVPIARCFYLGNLMNFTRVTPDYYSSDNTHLTEGGYVELGGIIYGAMHGHTPRYSKVSHNPAEKFLEYIVDDTYVLELFEDKNYEVNVASYTANGNGIIKSVPLTNGYLTTDENLFYRTNTQGFIKAGNNLFYPANFTVDIHPDRIDLRAFALNENNSNYVIDSISSVNIQPFTYQIPISII